jgi:hypothetical protein
VTDIVSIVSELEQQRAAIDRAISALQQIVLPEQRTRGTNSRPSAGTTVTRRQLSASGRRRIAQAARRRWAEIRAAKAALATEPRKAAKKMTAAKKPMVKKRASTKKTAGTKA